MAKRRSGAPHRAATRRTPLRLVAADERVDDDTSADPPAGLDGVPTTAAGDRRQDAATPVELDELVPRTGPVEGMRRGSPGEVGPQQLAQGIAAGLLRDLSVCRRPLEAELKVSELFAVITLGSRQEVDGVTDADDDPEAADQMRTELLTAVIEHAADAATGASLGLLRVLSILGPIATRRIASAHADRVAGSGVADPRWAAALGRPTLLRAWRYGDLWGSQSSIGLLFDYAGREHALLTLIDHELGGGVKDCFVVEGRAASRSHDRTAAEMANLQEATLEDVDAGRAALELREALTRPTCPVQVDQIETLALTEELLRSRTALLADLAELPAQDVSGPAQPVGHGEILRIKVSLTGARPPIWRRLELPASVSLSRLHDVLQAAFSWSDSHPHRFERPVPPRVRGFLPAADPGVIDRSAEPRTRLIQLLPDVGSELIYRYGGGDWEHLLLVEARQPTDSGAGYPLCTGGRRAAPPEDCGGIARYDHLVDVLADPGHPDHSQVAGRTPPGFDPETFSVADVNARFDPPR